MPDVLTRSLADIDPEVQAAVAAELRRQQETLEMIASENFAPKVAAAGVSVVTGGTDVHLVLVDLRTPTWTASRARTACTGSASP